jgi:hypothetical protein
MIQWRSQQATSHLLALRRSAAHLATSWRARRLALLLARHLYCLQLLLLLVVRQQQQQQQLLHLL